MANAPASLIDRMGGQSTIDAVVDRFHQRVLGDPQLAGHFDGVDREVLAGHQREFLHGLLSADLGTWPQRLHDAHRHLHLGDDAFDRIVRHLVDSLASTGVPTGAVEELRALLEDMRGSIVDPGGGRLRA